MTERQAIENTYWDRVDVYRRTNQKDEATKQTRQAEALVVSALPCALSQVRSGSHTMSGGYGVTRGSHILFFPPEADLRAGDRLVITTGQGELLEFRTGKPFRYPSHGEAPLTGEERA